MDDERNAGGVWSVDESGQFIRAAASPHQTHSSRLSQLDFPQPLQRPSSFEQPSHLDRHFIMHERMQRGNYETNSQPFERTATAGLNVDLVNTLGRFQGLDELHGQMGQVPSGNASRQQRISNQFASSHLDTMENHWSEPNGQLHNGLIESQLNQLHLEAEKQKRDRKMNLTSRDPNSWASLVGNDEGLADLLHHKMAHQSSQSLDLVDNREPSWLFSRPASDHSFNLPADKVGLSDSFSDGSLYNKVGQAQQDLSMNSNLERFESSGRSASQSSSRSLFEQKQFFSDIDEIDKEQPADSVGGDASVDRLDLSDVKEGKRVKKRSSKGKAMSRSVLDTMECGVQQAGGSVGDHGELEANIPIRHPSFGNTGGVLGFYNYETGVDIAYDEKMVTNKLSAILSRGADNSIVKRAHDPQVLSSAGAPSEFSSAPSIKGKGPTTFGSSEERRQELSGSTAVPGPENPSAMTRQEMRFRRTSSCSDADAPEASSFINMLKSTKKMVPESEPANEFQDAGGPGGKGGSKKKGKKGRQIDPSLLGFKVHSNRIMMGEIQRPDD